MLAYIEASIAAFVTIGVVVIFISFTLAAAGWIRLYFNKYEPVYIKSDDGTFVKNHIASRFCKIIISNVITDYCMEDVEYIGLWSLVVKFTDDISDEIKSITSLHLNILGSVEEHIDVEQYRKLSGCLKEIENSLFSNLDDSNIMTPPYLAARTYLLWVESAVDLLKRT